MYAENDSENYCAQKNYKMKDEFQFTGAQGDRNMKKQYEFEAEIEKVPDMDGAYVVVPLDIKNEFERGRIRVRAVFDGASYEGSIVNMGIKNPVGSVCYIIGLPKDIRAKIGKQPGDRVKVSFVLLAESKLDYGVS